MHWSDLDVIAKVLETSDEAPDLGGLGAAVEVIGAEVVIKSSVFEHMAPRKLPTSTPTTPPLCHSFIRGGSVTPVGNSG